jgi:hypothetical protein
LDFCKAILGIVVRSNLGVLVILLLALRVYKQLTFTLNILSSFLLQQHFRPSLCLCLALAFALFVLVIHYYL